MSPPLTPVPATLPGVVRRGTPLIYLGRLPASALGPPDGLDVPIGFHFPEEPGSPLSEPAPVESLTVDLTDATGRDHGLRALAAHFHRAAPGVWWLPLDDGRWSLRCEPRRGFVTFRAPGAPELSESRPEVPSLADLDPNDPTLLPDGSRWVDAEALARVLLHVLGVRNDRR